MSRSNREKGGRGRGDEDFSKKVRRSSQPSKRPSQDRDLSGGEKPLACLRSADVVYDLYEYTTRLGRGRSSDIVLTTSKSISSKHARERTLT